MIEEIRRNLKGKIAKGKIFKKGDHRAVALLMAWLNAFGTEMTSTFSGKMASPRIA